jgi:uncharacterized pyridoxal phosphate-containing UPF0001 family protein
MTMAPLLDDPEGARSFFRGLRELRRQSGHEFAGRYELTELSMGMSNDYEVGGRGGCDM